MIVKRIKTANGSTESLQEGEYRSITMQLSTNYTIKM